MDSAALEEALVRRTRHLVPDETFEGRGLVAALAESWTQDDDLAEALEYLARRYLEYLQEDVILESKERWPATVSGEIPEPFAVVDLESKTVTLGYLASDETFTLDPIPLHECLPA